MPLASFVSGATQSHILINQNVVANFGGFADYDAHAMIDKKTPADGGAWVNFDSGEKAGELRDHARHQRYVGLIELMGEPMEQDRMEPGIAQENLENALGGRVFAKYSVDLFPDCAKHKKRPLM